MNGIVDSSNIRVEPAKGVIINKRLKSPLSVQIEVTGECTSECSHCYNFWRDKSERSLQNIQSGILSKENAITILKKLGEAEVTHVTITGGEPLLNCSATLAIIELARSMNMSVGLNSNLVLLTEKKAVALKQAGLNHVLTSILGPTAEIHDSITQSKGSFRGLINGIKVAHDFGIAVSANMVVSQTNHEYVRETAQLVAELGIKNFMATKAGCPGNCSDFSHLAISRPQLVKFLNDLCWIHESLGLRVDTLEPVPLCGLYGVNRPELFTSRKCNAGVMTATISYNGLARPCPHLDMSYGNLLEEDLSAIWSRMAPWSQLGQIPTECSRCSMLSVCGSGCRMEGKTSTGKINGLDPASVPVRASEMAEIFRLSTKPPERTLVNKFKTPKFRLRKEDFGGVFISGNTQALLDNKGFAVLSQLESETEYNLAAMTIDWNGLDPEKFVSGLAYRKMILSV